MERIIYETAGFVDQPFCFNLDKQLF